MSVLKHRGPVGAVAAAALPVVAEVVLTIPLWHRLPDEIATTFGQDGSPSGYGTPLGTLTVLAVIQALFLIAAVGSAFARDRRKGRVACAVTAGFVATLAISWLIIAGLAASIATPAVWWALPAGPAWALIPYWSLKAQRDEALLGS